MFITKYKTKEIVLTLLPIIIGLLLSFAVNYVYGFGKVEFGDAEDYINGANAFLNNTQYPLQSVFHPMFRPPLFSAFIAGLWSLFPQSVIAVKIGQMLLHAATIFVAYKTVLRVLDKHSAAFCGALIVAVNPLLAGHTVDFFTEPLHTFLCILAMYWLVRFLQAENHSYFYAAGAGVAFGLSALNRPAILGVVVLLAAGIVLLQIRKADRAAYLGGAVLMLASVFLTIAPWTYRNYQATGEFILVNDGFSYNLWLGNLPETIRLYEGDFQSKEENQQFADYVWGTVQRRKIAELEQTDNFSALKINEREKVWRREALKNMTADYHLTGRLMIGKFKAFWTPFLNKYTYGRTFVWLVALFVIGTYIFGTYGAYVFAKTEIGGKYVVLLLITFAVTTAIHVLIFGFVRYRVPNVDPYLSMLAGVGMWFIAAKLFPQMKTLKN